MASNSLTLATLNVDVLRTIVDELLHLLRYDRNPMIVKPFLLPLSSTCKRFRELLAPSMFRRVSTWRKSTYVPATCLENEVWPRAIWKYIETVDVDAYTGYEDHMNFATIASIMPHLPALKLVRFQMDEPPQMLLNAAAIVGLGSLEFRKVRLDGPSLAGIFSRLKLTQLVLTAGLPRPQDLKPLDEVKHVDAILSLLSRTLIYLKISGDLVSFETLARLPWPCLCTLTLTDSIPSGTVVPLPTVISHMPRLRNLHYNFGAIPNIQIPPIVYWVKAQGFPPLSHTHPQLESFSISNIYAEEHTLSQLPQSLRSLRILALRERGRLSLVGPWYPFSDLSGREALHIIAMTAHLPNLVDLALTLNDLPSPAILDAVARSCPGLRTLEISRGLFDLYRVESPYPIESLIEPLTQLHHLRALRISIGFGQQYIGSVYYGLKDKTLLYCRMDSAANMFAHRLSKLNSLGFSFTNDGGYYGLREYVVWYMYSVLDDPDGREPVSLVDLDTGYLVSSEPEGALYC